MDKKIIGDKIAITRKKNNVSQKKLAELLCVNQSLLGRWERGESLPSLQAVLKISEIFILEYQYFIENVCFIEYARIADETRPKGRWSKGKTRTSFLTGDNLSTSLNRAELVGSDFSQLEISGKKFYKSDLCNTDFTGTNLSKNSFKKNIMRAINFERTNITDCIFSDNILNSSKFEKATLLNTHFKNVEFTCTQFKTTSFIKSSILSSDLTTTIFKDCVFDSVLFKSVDLSEICFAGQSFNNVKFDDTTLTGCSFLNSRLMNVSFRPEFVIKNKDYKMLKTLCFKGAIMDSLTYSSLRRAGVELVDINLIP